MLKETTDFSSVLAVAVADGEEVAVLQAHDVRRGDIGVLVRLVGVVGCNTSFGSKGEFGDYVADLVLRRWIGRRLGL